MHFCGWVAPDYTKRVKHVDFAKRVDSVNLHLVHQIVATTSRATLRVTSTTIEATTRARVRAIVVTTSGAIVRTCADRDVGDNRSRDGTHRQTDRQTLSQRFIFLQLSHPAKRVVL